MADIHSDIGPSDLEIQKNDVGNLMKKTLHKGDSWFLLDIRWYKQWNKYVGFNSWDTVNTGDKQYYPGPIDNSALFKVQPENTGDGGGQQLKEHMVDDLDYVLLPAEAWNKLVSWYRLQAGQEPIERYVIEQGMSVKHCKVEVYLMELKLSEKTAINTVISKQFSRVSTIEQLEQKMRQLYHIDDKKPVRLWNRYMNNTYEHLSKPKNTLQDSGLYQGQVIVLEQKNDDGPWPWLLTCTSNTAVTTDLRRQTRGTMATEAGVTTSEPSDHECSICNELFTDPKLLPCCHLLCRRCLIDLLESQPRAQCPLCRCPIVDPGKAGPKQRCDVIADGFPIDLAMVELVEADRLLKKDHQCCICVNSLATSLCLDCGDMFCKGCKIGHTRQKVAKHHNVQDLSCLTADQLTSHRPDPCPFHADKSCELFCPSRDLSMCHVCAASRHRSCPGMEDLQQKADESRLTLSQLAAKLTTAERELDLAMEQLDQHVQETKKKMAAGLAEMKAVCDRLKSAIDARYQRVKEVAEETCSDVIKRVQAAKACLLQRRGNVPARKRAVQRTIEAKGQHVVIGMTPVMMTTVENLDCSSSIPDGEKTMSFVTIVIDPGVVTVIDQQLVTMGQVQVISPVKVSSPQKPSN